MSFGFRRSRVLAGFNNSVKNVHRLHSRQYSRCFSTTATMQQQQQQQHVSSIDVDRPYSKFVFKGPSAKPSVTFKGILASNAPWDDCPLKKNDIMVVTPAKAGTTMTLDIVGQLLYFEGAGRQQSFNANDFYGGGIWPEMTLMQPADLQNMIQAQKEVNLDAKVLYKSHFAVETLHFRSDVKYIFLARDYRDMVWSLFNHTLRVSADFTAALQSKNGLPENEHVSPKWMDVFENESYSELDFWNDMLYGPDAIQNPDGFLYWSLLWVYASWWQIRDLPNVKFVHYNSLVTDLRSEIRGLSDFLEIEGVSEERLSELTTMSSLENMRQRAVANPLFEWAWQSGAKDFFFKGTNNRWKDVLTQADVDSYQRLATERYGLGADAMHWLETGHFN